MTEFSPTSWAKPEKLEQFAASVAHDFNNLLTGILGNLELMQNRATRSGITQFDDYLESARHAGGRAAIFAQRLLVFSGRAAQEFHEIELNAVLSNMIAPLRKQGLNLTFHPAPGFVRIFGDQGQTELALQELLDNAAEATAESGKITVELAISGDTAAITIRDTGTGMPAEILARALEPFFSTRTNGIGKGLGLPIAERVARQIGGTLEISSQADLGCTAILNLPLVKA